MRVSTLLVLSATQSVVGMTMNLSPKSNSVLLKSAKSQKKNSGDPKNSFARGFEVGLRAGKAGLAELPTGCTMKSGDGCFDGSMATVDCPTVTCTCSKADGTTLPTEAEGGMWSACAAATECAGTSEHMTSANADNELGTITCVAPDTTAGTTNSTAVASTTTTAAAEATAEATAEETAEATAEATATPN